MGSPTSYTIVSDSAYLTNGTLDSVTEGSCTTITVNNSTTFCVRIHRQRILWRGDRPLIPLAIPELTLHDVGETQVVDLGRPTRTLEVRGYLYETLEGATTETAYDKETNLRTLFTQSENGYSLVIGKDSDDQRIFPDANNSTDSLKAVFPKRVDIVDDAKEPRGGPRGSKPRRSVTMMLSVGKNLLTKS